MGKSTLLTKLTGTASEAAAYEFTTLTAVPGITRYNGARLQMLDLPGIIEGAADGKGRGRQVISTARTSNLILIILDVLKPITHKLLIEKELEGAHLHSNPHHALSWCQLAVRLVLCGQERTRLDAVIQQQCASQHNCFAGFGIRLNKLPPKLAFKRKEKGGINFVSHHSKPRLTRDEVIAVCNEYRIHNADVEVRTLNQPHIAPTCKANRTLAIATPA